MKIIIAGCGKIGLALAKHLVSENHEITFIEKNEYVLKQAITEYDCLGITGNAAVQKTLLDAGIENADILIACTDSDEVNMLTCLIAHKNSKCKTIARIRSAEYTDEIEYLKEELNLSMTINPELAAANDISRTLNYLSTISSDAFFKGKVDLLKVEVKDNSPLNNVKLADIQKKFECNLVLCLIERDDDIIIPKGNDRIIIGDKISFVADRKNAISFFKHAGFDYSSVSSMMIVGGGKIASNLIRNQIASDKNCSIKVIEQNKSICDELVKEFENISVINGNAADKRLLLQEGLESVDSFISLTGIDEENIVLSLYAKKMCKGKIITKINRTNFSEALKEINLGSIVNPEVISAAIILQYVRSMEKAKGSNIEVLYKLCDDRAEAVEFFVKNDSPITKHKFKELNFKKNIIVACIYRNKKVIIPKGDDYIMKYDGVVIISKDNKLNSIEDIVVSTEEIEKTDTVDNTLVAKS